MKQLPIILVIFLTMVLFYLTYDSQIKEAFLHKNTAFIAQENLPQEKPKKIDYEIFEKVFSENFEVKQLSSVEEKTIYLNIHFRPYKIGNIKIITGKIVANDPIVNLDSSVFKYDFPKGKFPVELAVGKYDLNQDERVGFARIKFSENAPIRWEMAVVEGQKESDLAEDEIFGYACDSGTGSFMDIQAQRALNASLNNGNDLIEMLEKNTLKAWSYAVWEGKEANVVLFSSGEGDGYYASYVGFDAQNRICRLVTDFALLEE